jgi:hypothetical protein
MAVRLSVLRTARSLLPRNRMQNQYSRVYISYGVTWGRFLSMAANTTPETTDATTTITRTTTSSTTTGPRQKRDVSFRKHHRRRQVTPTTTTPIPQTTLPPGTPPHVTGRIQEPQKEMYTISLEPALEAGGTYILHITFTGQLKDSLFGFYRSSYKGENGTKMYVFSTFRPNYNSFKLPAAQIHLNLFYF